MTIYVVLGCGDDREYDTDWIWDMFLSEASAVAEVQRLSALAIEAAGLNVLGQVDFARAHKLPTVMIAGYTFSIQKWEAKP